MKTWNTNSIINTVGVVICIIFVVLTFTINEQKVLIGVLFRFGLSLLSMYNAFYLIFSKKFSFISRKDEKYRRLAGLLLLLVGLFGFVTALMGYGINGYPLLDWNTVF